MKIKSLLTLCAAMSHLVLMGQSLNSVKSHFTGYLQGEDTPYTESHSLKWKKVPAQRAQVWQAWCEANHEFNEDKLPALQPLESAAAHRWPSPAATGRFTLYLSDDMVDFDKEVTLIVNGKQIYHGTVKPDTRHMVNSCATFFDPERVYAAGIEVKL